MTRGPRTLAAAACLCALVFAAPLSGFAAGADDELGGILVEIEGRGAPPTLLAQSDEVEGNLLIEPADEPPLAYDKKLDMPDTPMHERSIEELIAGTPLFPPIEGLPESIWKDKPCGACHQWTKERLCAQAKTYVGAEKMVGRLEHPYGFDFKQLLERWGEAGCP